MRSRAVRAGVAGLCLGLAACGGGGGSTPAPSPTPTNPNVITISSGGIVSPKQLLVAPGAQVLFVNNDTRRHDMTSDDHPDHLECPAINDVGLLMSGQSRPTTNLITIRTCGFHDHEDPDNATLKGQIIVR
jgi:plastocyanin